MIYRCLNPKCRRYRLAVPAALYCAWCARPLKTD
jgi:hypothetical protein